jgi:hypothetical protein
MTTGRSTDIACGYGAVAVTASDSTIIPTCRALYIGVTGAVAVRMANGDLVTFSAVAVGILPIQVNKVLSTGTTATTILAVY